MKGKSSKREKIRKNSHGFTQLLWPYKKEQEQDCCQLIGIIIKISVDNLDYLVILGTKYFYCNLTV